MAKDEKASEKSGEGAKPKKSMGALVPLIVPLVSLLSTAGAAGFMAYSKLLYKRPKIVEEVEREKVVKKYAKSEATDETLYVKFDPITVNISPAPGGGSQPVDGSPAIDNKLHYTTVGFVLQINNKERQAEIDAIKTKMMDEILGVLGRKQIHELTTVQGRYVLRTQIIEICNRLVAAYLKTLGEAETRDDLVTNVFFTQFVVQ